MAFDAAMVRAVTNELSNVLTGARVDKIFQPEKDEVLLILRTRENTERLLISASANNPRIHLFSGIKENPANPPQFCILLRKHLSGGRVASFEQLGFERVIRITFSSKDDMGYPQTRFLYSEIMGKYSNLILTDENDRILGAIKQVDFTTSQKRQVLPGMTYELPPAQDKCDPTSERREAFLEKRAGSRLTDEKFITASYLGLSSLTAREIAFGSSDTYSLWKNFERVMDIVRSGDFSPCLIVDEQDLPVEFSFMEIAQYQGGAKVIRKPTVSEVIESFFSKRDNVDHNMQRASDLFKKISNIKARIRKKTSLQLEELENSEKKEEYKLFGDLITANIYAMHRGMKQATVINYYDENCDNVTIPLDERLTPSQNAQRYYKKYTKAKNAEAELKKQLEISEKELLYIDSVLDHLTRAHGQSELDEIRFEVEQTAWFEKRKGKKNNAPSKLQSSPLEYRTSGGYRVLCGKNNLQNDRISFKIASKNDWWFHVKNMPGSHTVMICNGEEPSERDFTEAATIAAVNSSAAESKHIAVDYTLVKNLKKPAGSNPGFVVYYTNYSAYVNKDIELEKSLRIDGK